ncbi:SGNH/GDSL hydrolase family protein [Caulobacter sp.]|uniref:SGNH/GDSL hydrolase family protein n=1 Tax=Caulobacter sp. TaxID=78 RepID=UPI003BAC2BEC
MIPINRRVLALAAAFALTVNVAADAREAGRWIGSWASAQQVPEERNALPANALDDATLRQIVRLTAGGNRLRVRISNAFGTTPLRVMATHVARPLSAAGAAIDPATDRAVTFAGEAGITIPAGAEYLSDPVSYRAVALSDLAVTIHVEKTPAVQTSHPGARATSYIVAGDKVAAADLPEAKTVDHWFQLSGVEVEGGKASGAIVLLGDSITDGYGVKANTNQRWPDAFAARLQANRKTRGLGVLNLGIGGNRLLLDGAGPNAAARFNRDVLMQAGVSHVLILEGVNDLGVLTRDQPVGPDQHASLVSEITTAYAQMVQKARARGIKVIGATIMPYGASAYYHPDALNEQDRQAVNAWIRAPGNFDAVVDMDKVMRDPARPERLAPAYDSGDGLHPSMAGYRVMAEAIPLELFAR